MNKKVYTVAQVNGYIGGLLSQDLTLRNLSVSGELSGVKYHAGGHLYFSLKDESGVISCIMFASDLAQVSVRLRDGMKVVVTGAVRVYLRGGSYQLYARRIELDGVGQLYEQLQQLREKLGREGLFDEARKRPIPAYAFEIGVVTSESGAVIRDIVRTANRRNPFVQITLCPALVQGEGAAASICRGIRRLDRMGLDVIIVGRGGGSIEDLWAFNEEPVVRAIAACQTPVISAVGHETDVTLSDLAADLRASTPTAAAEQSVFLLEDMLERADGLSQALRGAMAAALAQGRARQELLASRLERYHPMRQLRHMRERAGQQTRRLDRAMRQQVRDASARSEGLTARLEPALRRQLREASYTQTGLAGRLGPLMRARLQEASARMSVLEARLSAASPQARLAAGFAYVETESGPLTRVAQTAPGQRLTVRLRDGSLKTVVEEIEPEADT